MVAKISLGNSLYAALTYNAEKINKEKGRLLDTNKIYNDGSGSVNTHRVYEDFQRWMPAHTKTERPMMHISLNPHPDDRLSDTDYTRMAHEYMQKMGLGDMPYLIFKHEDIDRHHIHIVALRVGTDGKAVSDKNNFYRSKDICRELEKKYGLKPAERQRVSPDTPIMKIDPADDLKRQVANTVKLVGMRYRFQTMGEFNAILSLYNVKAEQTDGRVNGREYHGLVYFATDDNGKVIANPFKASRLGRFASRTAIDGRFERAKKEIDDKALAQRTKRIVASVLIRSSGKEDFIERLKAEKIDVVFRYTAEGRIYGATFIDHNTKCVLNGSRLGREFSANAFEQRFNGGPAVDMTVVPVQDIPEDNARTAGNENRNQTDSDSSRSQSQPQPEARTDSRHGHAHTDNSDYMPSIPGLDLFQVGPGYDPEEEAFYRAMQRRKKKGRRPKF